MGNWFNGISRVEASGLVLFAIAVVMALGFRIFWHAWVPPLGSVDLKRLDSLASVLDKRLPKENRTLALDINKVNVDSLVAIGFSDKQAHIFINYRTSIGGFTSLEQIDKVYGLSEALREKVKRWAASTLPQIDTNAVALLQKDRGGSDRTATWQRGEYTRDDKPARLTIDMNLANAQVYEKLSGVGPTLAARIVKYRNVLGGFVNRAQLFEVYGMDSTQIQLEHVVMQFDSLLIKKLRVNDLDAAALASHPYIDYKQANLLINYRQHHGKYLKQEDLLQSKAFTESELARLAPYLSFD